MVFNRALQCWSFPQGLKIEKNGCGNTYKKKSGDVIKSGPNFPFNGITAFFYIVWAIMSHQGHSSEKILLTYTKSVMLTRCQTS